MAVVKEMKELEMYEWFHHKKPDAVVKALYPEIPKSLMALGKLYIIEDQARITKREIMG